MANFNLLKNIQHKYLWFWSLNQNTLIYFGKSRFQLSEENYYHKVAFFLRCKYTTLSIA